MPIHQSPPLSFSRLLTLIRSLFTFPSATYAHHAAAAAASTPQELPLLLQFRDEEDELITINSEEEWHSLQTEVRDRGQRVLLLFAKPAISAQSQPPAAAAAPAVADAAMPGEHEFADGETAAASSKNKAQRCPSSPHPAAAAPRGQYEAEEGGVAELASASPAPLSAPVAHTASFALEVPATSLGPFQAPREAVSCVEAALSGTRADGSGELAGSERVEPVEAAPSELSAQSGGDVVGVVDAVGCGAALPVPDAAFGSDEESPVLVDGVGVPSAPDSLSASAVLRRRQYLRQQAKVDKKRRAAVIGLARALQDGALPGLLPLPIAMRSSPLRPAADSELHGQAEQPPIWASPVSPPVPPSRPLPVVEAPASPRLADGDGGGDGVAAAASAAAAGAAALSPTSLFSSPPTHFLTQGFHRARAQLRSLLPFSHKRRSPEQQLTALSGEGGAGGGRSAAPDARESAAQLRSTRVETAFVWLASFVEEEGERLSCEEVLQRCISLYTYSLRWLTQQRQQRQQRRQQRALAGGADEDDRSAAEEEQSEAAASERLRSLLRDVQDCGLRSQSAMDCPSSALSPALVTLLTIAQSHLGSRTVTDLPVTLEIFAAILAQQAEDVRREESHTRHTNNSSSAHTHANARVASSLLSPPSPQLGERDVELAASLTALPLPLQAAVRSVLLSCAQHAEEAAALHPSLSFSSLSPHSFASALQAFRMDLADLVHDEATAKEKRSYTQSACSSSSSSAAPRPPAPHLEAEHAGHDGHQAAAAAAFGAHSALHPPHSSLRAPAWEEDVNSASMSAVVSSSQLSAGSGGAECGVLGRVYGVGSDVMVSDDAVLKAVAKALRKEQKLQRKERKTARRKASKGKGHSRILLEQAAAEEAEEEREAEELSALVQHMNSQQQSRHANSGGSGSSGGVDSRMFPGGWTLFPSPASPAAGISLEHSAAISHRAAVPLASSPSPAMDPSPSAYQPWPYHLHSSRSRAVDGAAAGGVRARAASQLADASTLPSLYAQQQPHAANVALSADPVLHSPLSSLAAPLRFSPSQPPQLPLPSFASLVSASHRHAASPAPASPSPLPLSSPSLSSLLSSLRLMGFTDDELNLRLLQQHQLDLNRTVDWLLVHAQ